MIDLAAKLARAKELKAKIEADRKANPLAYYIANPTPTLFHQSAARER